MEQLIGRSWGRAFGKNRALIHCDMSNNELSDEACRIIGKKLKKNHTLFGIHMAGNACQVDTFGHLIFDFERPEPEKPNLDSNGKPIPPGAAEKKPAADAKATPPQPQTYRPPAQPMKYSEILFNRMEGTSPVIKKKNPLKPQALMKSSPFKQLLQPKKKQSTTM